MRANRRGWVQLEIESDFQPQPVGLEPLADSQLRVAILFLGRDEICQRDLTHPRRQNALQPKTQDLVQD